MPLNNTTSMAVSDTLPVIDTHVHFDDDRFDEDRIDVYQRAQSAGVSAMVVPATMASRFNKIQCIANEFTHVYATAGLHPMFSKQHQPAHLETLGNTLQHCVAIGECGLDKPERHTDITQQEFWFEAQIDLARTQALPLIIHARNTVEAVILMLKRAALSRSAGNGVVHSFNGSLQQAHQLLDLNYKVSFGGPITYPRAHKLHKLVASLPLEAMMFETDAPDQPGIHQRGQRNEPAWISQVTAQAAEIRKTSVQEVTAASNLNAVQLFALPEQLLKLH